MKHTVEVNYRDFANIYFAPTLELKIKLCFILPKKEKHTDINSICVFSAEI